MNYLKSLRQARARDVYTNIKVRTTGNILRWKTQFKHPLVSDSFLAIWSPLVNLMIGLQACIDISFFKNFLSITIHASASFFEPSIIRDRKEMGKRGSKGEWLRKQNKDQYVLTSRREGLRSRAAFKLEQINKKYKILNLSLIHI